MAGETPNANRISKQRRLAHLDDRNTDKTYRSGQVSALNPGIRNTGSLRSGETVAKPASATSKTRVVDRTIVRSADEYYREGGAAVPGQKVAKTATKQAATSPNRPMKKIAPPVDVCNGIIASRDDVNAVVDQAVGASQAGIAGRILVVNGRNDLLRHARTNLELRVTREELTEEQARDISFGFAPGEELPADKGPAVEASANELFGEPKPKEDVSIDEDDIGDVDDFLKAPSTPEETQDAQTAAPVGPPTEVDTSEPGDEDIDSFLVPDVADKAPEEAPEEAAAPEIPAMEPEPEPEAAPVVSKPSASRGRRGGRGS